MNEYVVASADAWLNEPDAAPVFIRQGERWWAGDPLVKRHPGAFVAPAADDIRGTPPREPKIEQATKAPGEKRTRG
jgi:hypothetical protein